MTFDDEKHIPEPASQYAAQLHKAQQNLKQFIPKYRRLVEAEKRLREENQELRSEIERFNRRLITREHELEQLQGYFSEFLALLHQIHREERRSPNLHARPHIRHHFLRHPANTSFREAGEPQYEVPQQTLLPLNIWLVSQNRFTEQIISFYTRRRERLLIIENAKLVRQLLEADFFPDIIITGAYDFGLDDPFQQSFSGFLEQIIRDMQAEAGLADCFVITLSASIPVQSETGLPYQGATHRHKYISKLHGLQVTISEVRFFLELRRCQHDIMEAERFHPISSMREAAQMMTELQNQNKTGLLVVLSDEDPPDIRWAFQLFYLRGKLVKTEHTLESSALITDDGTIEPLEKDFIFTSFDSQYTLNAPQQLFFFPLYEQTVIREIKEAPVSFF